MRQVLLVAAALVMCAGSAGAIELKLTGPVSDNMVFQRDKPIRVWGTAGQEVSIDLGNQHVAATPDQLGHWTAELKPMPAGGPVDLTVSAGDQKLALHNILIGDVWLCSGQSNMQLTTSEDLHAGELLRDAEKLSNVRLMVIPKSGADKPRDEVKVKWLVSSAKSAEKFSDVGFQFGRFLSQDDALKNVPIGLIDDSFGGTAIEGWTPQAALDAAGFKSSDLMASMFNLKPTSLYNGMIAPLGPTAFRGVLWYQGENNSPRAGLYPRLFAAMAGAWREQFHDPLLPIFLVQLPPFDSLYGGYPFTWMREAQQRAADTVPNTGIAISIDTCDGFDLHPRDKGKIAKRLSLLARHDVYHESVVCQGPKAISSAVEGSMIRVKFDTHGSGLTSTTPGEVTGFQLAGEDGVYRFAQARIDGSDVVVQEEGTPEPKTVRYAWGANPSANLMNGEGLPAGPFRTDSAPITLPIEVRRVPQQHRLTTSSYDIVINGDGTIPVLMVGGREFLANSVGPGAAHFGGGFGPQQLLYVTQVSENAIRYSNAQLSITYSFAADSMTWTINNQGGPATLQFDLAANAKVADSADGKTSISVDDSHLEIDSVVAVKHGNRTTLEAKVGGKATKVITLKASGQSH